MQKLLYLSPKRGLRPAWPAGGGWRPPGGLHASELLLKDAELGPSPPKMSRRAAPPHGRQLEVPQDQGPVTQLPSTPRPGPQSSDSVPPRPLCQGWENQLTDFLLRILGAWAATEGKPRAEKRTEAKSD